MKENTDDNKLYDFKEFTAEFISIDKEKSSFEERVPGCKIDLSNVTNDANFKKEKASVGNIFRDTNINVSKINPVKLTDQTLKRKSKILSNFFVFRNE